MAQERNYVHPVAPRRISKRARFYVLKRDQFKCVYCGATPSETVFLEIDHVRPIAEGGTNHISNLVAACRDCNRGKGAELLPGTKRPNPGLVYIVPDHELSTEVFEQLQRKPLSSLAASAIRYASPQFDTVGDLRSGILSGEFSPGRSRGVGKMTMKFIKDVVLARIVP
jgi:hypothetical protein